MSASTTGPWTSLSAVFIYDRNSKLDLKPNSEIV